MGREFQGEPIETLVTRIAQSGADSSTDRKVRAELLVIEDERREREVVAAERAAQAQTDAATATRRTAGFILASVVVMAISSFAALWQIWEVKQQRAEVQEMLVELRATEERLAGIGVRLARVSVMEARGRMLENQYDDEIAAEVQAIVELATENDPELRATLERELDSLQQR